MIMFWIIFGIVWVVCGTLAYGAYFAHFQRKFPDLVESQHTKDRSEALVMGVLGPFGLFGIGVAFRFKYGFKFK